MKRIFETFAIAVVFALIGQSAIAFQDQIPRAWQDHSHAIGELREGDQHEVVQPTPTQIAAHEKAELEEAAAYGRLQDAILQTRSTSQGGKYKLSPGQVANDCWQYGTLAQCGHALGFFDPNWYGAVPNNSGADNAGALLAAETAACTDGNKRIKVQIGGRYNFQTQVNHPCNGLIRFSDPQNVMYDGNNPNDAVEFYANTGFFSSANRCVFNDNGFTDQSDGNINYGGDGGQNGYAMFCNSHNFTGSGQIPRHYFFNMGISGTGVAWGCGLNTGIGSPTKLTQPYSGSGNTCGNYLGYRAFNVIVEESGQAANGNLTDFDWSGPFSACAGNAAGCITGTSNGTQGVYVDIPRTEEVSNSGFSGINTAGSPAYEVNGPNWLIKTQWQGNVGMNVLFDGNCGKDVIEGSYGGDGAANVSGAQSEFGFNATCSLGITFANLVGISGGYGLVAPPYFFQNLSGNSTIAMIGGDAESTQYSSAFENDVSGKLSFAPLMTAGQTPSFNGNTIQAGTTSGAITLQPQAAAGTYNWNWPITAGSAGQVLTSQGGGATAMTWGSPVSSFTGDGTVLNNSASTGSVTAALANATAQSLLGNATGSAAAPSYLTSPVLSGSISVDASGALNTTPVFQSGTAGVSGYVKHVYNGVGSGANSFIGIYNSSTSLFYGIAPSLPPPIGVAALGGYFKGMAIAGTTSSGNNPIFAILNGAQSGSGLGSTAFGVTDTNVITTFNNTLDDGAGNINASTGYKAGGTAGVSCSGTPTSSFASVHGIVTHC